MYDLLTNLIDYYHFQAAVCQQWIYQKSDVRITKCWVRHKERDKSKPFSISKTVTKEFDGLGYAQIWNELEDGGYHVSVTSGLCIQL